MHETGCKLVITVAIRTRVVKGTTHIPAPRAGSAPWSSTQGSLPMPPTATDAVNGIDGARSRGSAYMRYDRAAKDMTGAVSQVSRIGAFDLEAATLSCNGEQLSYSASLVYLHPRMALEDGPFTPNDVSREYTASTLVE